MTIYVVPTSSNVELSSYTQRTSLDGVTYVFRFDYSERSRKWHFSIYDINNVALAQNVKLTMQTVFDVPTLGLLYLESKDADNDPQLGELGAGFKLQYADTATIAEVIASTDNTPQDVPPLDLFYYDVF